MRDSMWPININYKSHETPGYSSSGLACRRQAYGTLGGLRLVPTARDSFFFIKACPDYFGGKRTKKPTIIEVPASLHLRL
jgi:hypothetical protein